MQRADDLALCRALAIVEVTRIAEHAANRRDAVGGVEKQRALDGRIRSRSAGNVRVHLGERPASGTCPCRRRALAPAGICALAAGAIDAIFPSRTITVWSARTASVSIGDTLTPTNAVWPPRLRDRRRCDNNVAATTSRATRRSSWISDVPRKAPVRDDVTGHEHRRLADRDFGRHAWPLAARL